MILGMGSHVPLECHRQVVQRLRTEDEVDRALVTRDRHRASRLDTHHSADVPCDLGHRPPSTGSKPIDEVRADLPGTIEGHHDPYGADLDVAGHARLPRGEVDLVDLPVVAEDFVVPFTAQAAHGQNRPVSFPSDFVDRSNETRVNLIGHGEPPS